MGHLNQTNRLPASKWPSTCECFRTFKWFQTLPFTDVFVQAESFRYINALHSYAITTGTSASTYSPGNRVTRGQLAVFITRAENAEKQTLLLNMKDRRIHKHCQLVYQFRCNPCCRFRE